MTRAMAILHQWDAAGRDNRSNGLAEGHNEIVTSENPYFQLCRPGLSSKLPLRGENELISLRRRAWGPRSGAQVGSTRAENQSKTQNPDTKPEKA